MKYPEHKFNIKLAKQKASNKKIRKVVEIAGVSKKEAKWLITEGMFIRRKIPKKVASRTRECLESVGIKFNVYKKKKKYTFKPGYR